MKNPPRPHFTISLETGQFTTDGETSILDAALANGILVPFSCRRGECGSCRAVVLDGHCERIAQPTESSYAAASDELLMCQCRAASDLKLRFAHWCAPAKPAQRREVRVVSQQLLAADVTRLIVELQTQDAFDYRPGQHVQVLVEGGGHRCFSIANPFNSAVPGRLEFHIRRIPGGAFTDRCLRRLMPNDTLVIDGPHGSCAWPAVRDPNIEHLVLLATGTGFAGVFPIVMAALETGTLKSVTLYWGARSLSDCYASNLLDDLQQRHKAFVWRPVLSGPASGSVQDGDLVTSGHVQDAAVAAGHDWTGTMVYACGNSAMVRAARERLCATGLAAERFLSEAFVPSGATKPIPVLARAPHAWERVGAQFTGKGILSARQRSMAAVQKIAALMTPGITTGEAIALADSHLRRAGALHNWHPTYVRFGPDTQSPSVRPTDRHRRLGENDVFVIDVGPVWDGYEGDYGDTFVTGDNADHRRCAQAARDIFKLTRIAWLQGLAGSALYDHADALARERGCTLVRDVAGHRVSDFPHALYGKHRLAHADFIPADGVWVLEIQVRDLALPIGAFFEDVLLREPT